MLTCTICGHRPWPKLPELPGNREAVPEEMRKGFRFKNSSDKFDLVVDKTWAAWADYHRELGQALALRMREYGGPAEQETPPEGGTPVMAQIAEAA